MNVDYIWYLNVTLDLYFNNLLHGGFKLWYLLIVINSTWNEIVSKCDVSIWWCLNISSIIPPLQLISITNESC